MALDRAWTYYTRRLNYWGSIIAGGWDWTIFGGAPRENRVEFYVFLTIFHEFLDDIPSSSANLLLQGFRRERQSCAEEPIRLD